MLYVRKPVFIMTSVLISALMVLKTACANASEEVGSASVVCNQDTGSSALQIYEQARARWTRVPYPDDIHYEITIALSQGTKLIERHYVGHDQPSRNVIDVNRVSAEEAALPLKSHGINAVVSFEGATIINFTRWQPTYDIIGVPEISPVYAFGLAGRAAFESDLTSATAGMKTIASVAIRKSSYRIACANDETESATAGVDHIILDPLIDPNDYRLRELWIDSKDHWIKRAIISRNFSAGPPLRCRWEIEFNHDANNEYISREVALGALDYGRAKVYDSSSIEFTLITVPDSAASRFAFLGDDPRDDNSLREP